MYVIIYKIVHEEIETLNSIAVHEAQVGHAYKSSENFPKSFSAFLFTGRFVYGDFQGLVFYYFFTQL